MNNTAVIEHLPKVIGELQKGILLNTKNGDKINTMTIAWGQVGIEWNKLLFTAYVRQSRFTFEQLEKSKEFTISIPKERTPEIIKSISICGSETGRNGNKFEKAGLTPVEGRSVKSPAVKELPITLECKVIYEAMQEGENLPETVKNALYPLDDDGHADYHKIFYGEIVNAYILE